MKHDVARRPWAWQGGRLSRASFESTALGGFFVLNMEILAITNIVYGIESKLFIMEEIPQWNVMD